MELWMEIALGITVGELIILLLKSFKNKIDNHNQYGDIYYRRQQENLIEEMKNNMISYCLFSAFALICIIVIMNEFYTIF